VKTSGRKVAVLLLVLAATARAEETPSWPPFLPPRETYAPAIVTSVESAYADPTLRRTVDGDVAEVPRETYLTFVDAPDLTAAAARHLRIAHYDVTMIGPDWYRADDHSGARGVYHVLARDEGRRVILSWGSHTGRILGTIRGHALSVLDFEARGRETTQRLSAYVLIENAFAARLARLLAPAFGRVIDRKLTEGFRTTAKVAEWAVRHPAEFCDWFARAPLPIERREALADSLPSCATAVVTPARR
jgi:hypothetical protein